MKKKKLSAIFCAVIVAFGLIVYGNAPKADNVSAKEESSNSTLFADKQDRGSSPEWVTKLDVAKEAEQFIVVAGVAKHTASISMHEKRNGKWEEIISTPGFIGEDGLGKANIRQALTPVGTFTIDKAFGIADDPGCQMEYTKVDDDTYWSGDPKYEFNKLVSKKDYPDIDTKESEHIIDADYEYQYVLNMGYNSECEVENGFAFFFHCLSEQTPYTGGCVAVPESTMKVIMRNIKPGCKITIDTMENLGGEFR